MKAVKYYIFTIAVGLASVVAATAQDVKTTPLPVPTPIPADAKPPVENRGAMIRQLGLTRDQMDQVRKLNGENKLAMEAAQKRSRDSNQALDAAIYADQSNETDVQARLREFQAAQADVIKLRSLNEFAVRRVLTPEQLVKFRQLRQRFEETRQDFIRRQLIKKPANEPAGRPAAASRQTVRAILRQGAKAPK